MTRVAVALFALLVASTVGAFFVTQRLKQSPRLVRTLTVTRAISPHVPYRRASIRIRLTRTDEATVSIVSADGDVVRHLVRGRAVSARQRVRLLWNGRDDRGQPVPDGEYSVRIGLRRQGRSVVLLDTITVDGTPPRPVVRVRHQSGAGGPLLVPLRRGGPARFRVLGTRVASERLFIYRTDGRRPRFVSRLPARRSAQADGTWNGRIRGRPAPPGPYVVVARDTDEVGNAASSFPFTPRRPGEPAGGAGVTVRYLASQAPVTPARVGRLITVFVDSRGRQYRWRLHRLGQARTITKGTSRSPALRLHAPGGPSGVYVVELAAGPHRSAALVPVQGLGRHPVLVVLPLVSWQGRNRADDDGDGMVDSLEANGRASLARPLSGGGVPQGFADNEQPLLHMLDRPQQRYDLTTDAALSAPGAARQLRAHPGVVLSGNPRWLPPGLTGALRDYVGGGGRVFSPGTDALRRTVRLRGDQLSQPSPPASDDLFGATLAPVVRRRVELLAGKDRIGLFRGGDGLFRGFSAFEETLALGPGARQEAVAERQGAQVGAPVIVAARLGRGLVIRTGLPEWETHIARDLNVSALTRRSWSLLSR